MFDTYIFDFDTNIHTFLFDVIHVYIANDCHNKVHYCLHLLTLLPFCVCVYDENT